MWLPSPIYERIPQFWFLLGLLFISIGVFVGIDFPLFFLYIIVGFVCCNYGIGIYMIRQFHRQLLKAQHPATAEQTPASG